MKTPLMNKDGYEKSAISVSDGFKNKKFLLIHGTADDNVIILIPILLIVI